MDESQPQGASKHSGYTEIFINSGGISICLSIYENTPQSPPVLFLPGTMVHPLFYDDFLTALSHEGFNVIGLHFLSHGKSPRIKEDFTLDDMVRNVKDALSYIQTRWEAKVLLMGSSQGSVVAMAAAADEERIAALFLHDAVLPELKETMLITRAPQWLSPLYAIVPPLMRFAARLWPKYQISLTSYLEEDRLTLSREIIERYYADELSRKSYPLSFLASLFSVDLTSATDGSLRCPVVVIAAKGDPLFAYSYICKVYEKIAAPKKEMLAFDLPCHLLFVEAVDEVVWPIAEKLKGF